MMVDFYKGSIPVIDPDEPTDNTLDMLFPEGATFGLVQRNYELFPEKMFAQPSEIEMIPRTEWDARFDEQEERKSSLEHVYLSGPNGTPAFENLDQGTEGYCWVYSVGHSIMMHRLKCNLQYVRLNPHSVGAIIKRGANDGGWCGEAAQFCTDVGMAPEGDGEGQWPLHSRDIRLDTPELRASMARFRIKEQFVDLTQRVWNRNMTMDQIATTSFLNLPGPGDYHWWTHSVCRLRWVRIERGSWGQLILNSWKRWGRYGLAVLRGNKAICNGALAIRSTVI